MKQDSPAVAVRMTTRTKAASAPATAALNTPVKADPLSPPDSEALFNIASVNIKDAAETVTRRQVRTRIYPLKWTQKHKRAQTPYNQCLQLVYNIENKMLNFHHFTYRILEICNNYFNSRPADCSTFGGTVPLLGLSKVKKEGQSHFLEISVMANFTVRTTEYQKMIQILHQNFTSLSQVYW